jgi:hypothetical protein
LGIAPVLLATGFLVALSQSQTPDKYQTLLARLKQGDRTVDFLELRRAYAASPDYIEGSDRDESKAMSNALDQGDYSQALERAKKILEKYYLDIDAHQVAYLANRELHIQTEADFHHFVAHGLIDAIFQSGDCKTQQTACEVLSTHEEYIILQVLGLTPGSQGLVNSGKHSFDVLDATDPKTQKKVTLYFNIDAEIGHFEKIFSK